MIYNRKISTLLLVFSFCPYATLRKTSYKQNWNTLHTSNGEYNDHLRKSFKSKKDPAESHDTDSYKDFNGLVSRPNWKIKSSRTESYSYEGFVPDEESNFNSDIKNLNRKKIGLVDLRITHIQETCFQTVQNEIANLFYEDLDISKKIFPLCCKKETKFKQTPTKCMSILRTLPRTTQIRQELTQQSKKTRNTLKELTPSCVHHSVSNEAVVNVVIHVKCGHPEAREHVLPTTLSLHNLPFNCVVKNNNVSHLDIGVSKYNFSVNTKTTEITKYSFSKIENCLNETNMVEETYNKKCENGRPNERPDSRLFGEPDTKEDTSNDNLKRKFPKPLLPHDITIKISKPTHKLHTTNFPAFICKITPRFCNVTGKKSDVQTKSVKPGITLWKKINMPHFWDRIPIATNSGCPETDRQIVEPTCSHENPDDKTTEEDVVNRDSCLPDDMNVTKESSVNNCDALESVVCEPIATNEEQTESSNLIRDDSNKSRLTFTPFCIESDLEIRKPTDESTLMSNEGIDQTLSETCYAVVADLQVVTEPVRSPVELEEPSSEPCQLYPGSGQSCTKADQLCPECVSPSVELNQPNAGPKKTHNTGDDLNTELGQGWAKNYLQPNYKEKTTVKNGEFGLPSSEFSQEVTESSNQNVLLPGYFPTGGSGPFTEPKSLLILKTGQPLTTKGFMVHSFGTSSIENGLSSNPGDDISTQISSTSLDQFNILKPTVFIENAMHRLLDKSSEEYFSTGSINKLIESDQSSQEFSMRVSEAAAETSMIIDERNKDTTISNPGSSIIIDSTHYPSSEDDISRVPISLVNHLNSIEEHNNKINGEEIKNIIDLNNHGFLFYNSHKWFISNRDHLWNFDEGTIEIVNDTYIKISIEHSSDNNENNKEIIKRMFNQRGAYNDSEEVPFGIYVQAILLYSEYNPGISTFEWSGVYFNLNEMIAMLRITNFDSLTVDEYGSVNWITIYRLVKESPKTNTENKHEYNITEVDGSVHTLIVFSNGSSIWKSIKLEKNEILNKIKSLNSNTYFFKQTILDSYKQKDPSFISFVKNVFDQRINSNLTYSEYVWESGIYNWDEILALLVMINTTLTDISNLETSIRQNWDELLVKFRNSKRHYYTDRIIYDISFDSQLKPMTVFSNGTTDFDGKILTLDDVAQSVKDYTVSEVPTTGVQHIINLGEGKIQFYWNKKWYITDHIRTWSFEDHTSALMNESFFGIPEDLTISRDSIQKLLVESSFSNNYEMPFELFTQSMLTTAKYSVEIQYQWSGYSLSYTDIFAMLRLSNFNEFNEQALGYKWGQINWHIIYDKVKQSPKTTSSELQAYEILDYNGHTYPLVVFSNGTSIWKHYKLDLTETLSILQNLNSKANFPDVISVSSYISNADSFLSFMTGAIADRSNNKVLHSFYIWKDYQFKWEDLVAINRILLHHYESKLANDLSFSKIALPILSSTKQTFPNRTEFQVSSASENKPLIVYQNGTTEYDNKRLEFVDTVQQVEELKQSSNMAFKEDWDSGVITLKEVKANNTKTEGDSSHSYDWKQLNNNPFFNVCYPINLGGGKVQFYMKNTWFITNGENIWPFEDSLTSFYINEMVKSMNQTFSDDPHLDKTAIQNLVDSKQTLKGPEEMVMPHELMIQHYFFFMKQLDQQIAINISRDIVYQRERLHINSVQLIYALRLSSYNNFTFTTTEVELPWGKENKLNWDWFFFIGRKSERMKILDEWADALNTSFFDEFRDTPLLVVYSNFSSDWGGHRLELKEALVKIQKANERNSFLPLEVNGELSSQNDSFEWLYKEALKTRFENKKTYFKYKWLTDTVSWFDMLAVIRYPEVKPEAVRDNAFWKNSIKEVTRSWKNKYSDRIEYEISGMDSNKVILLTIYMNESTILNGKKMDIEEYKEFL